MKKLFYLFVLMTFVIKGYAQDRVNAEQPVVSKPVSVLKKAKGWVYTEYDGKWFSRNNAIRSIDDFSNFTFSEVSYQGKRYLYLKKNYIAYEYEYPYIQEGLYSVKRHIDFIMELESYKSALSHISNDKEIKIKLIYFGRGFPNGFLKENKYKESYDLIIRYRLYEKTARFIIYSLMSYEDSNRIRLEALTGSGFFEGENLLKIIQNEDIFAKFYYECKLDNFLKFIKAPLNL